MNRKTQIEILKWALGAGILVGMFLSGCGRSRKPLALKPSANSFPDQSTKADPSPTSSPPIPSVIPIPAVVNEGTIFAVGRDGQVYRQAATNPRGDMDHPEYYYRRVGAGGVKQIAVVDRSPLTPIIIAIGMDDRVYWQRADNPPGDENHPELYYQPLAPGRVRRIALGYLADGTPLLFVIRLEDEQVYWRPADPFAPAVDSNFDYRLVGPGQVKQIALGVPTSGDLTVFAVGMDDQVYRQPALVPPGTESMARYQRVGAGGVKQIVVGYPSGIGARLYAIGMDDQVYWQSADNLPGENPRDFYRRIGAGGVKHIDLAPGRDGLVLFGIGMDGQLYKQMANNSPGSNSAEFYERVGAGGVINFCYSSFR